MFHVYSCVKCGYLVKRVFVCCVCVVLCVVCCVVLCCVVCVREKKVVRGKKNSMVWYSFPVDIAVANAHLNTSNAH